MNPDTALVEIAPRDAYAVFTTQDAILSILDQIRQKIDVFEPDVSSDKGRKEIKSFAYSISQSKTYLEGVGKDLTDEAKEIPKKIDAARKTVRDTLDGWRDEVRKPVDEWEAQEEERVQSHVIRMEKLGSFASPRGGDDEPYSAEQLRQHLSEAESYLEGVDQEEFEDEYRVAMTSTVTALITAIEQKAKADAEAAELAQLRKDMAEREERDVKEAAEKKAAEEEEQRQAEAKRREEAIKKEAEEKAEREKKAAGEKAEREKEDALQAERDAAKEREEKLRQEKEAAEQAALDAAEKAKQDQADRKVREEAAAAKRKADEAHKASVDDAAVAALEACGISKDHAKLAVVLISENKIPSITIQY